MSYEFTCISNISDIDPRLTNHCHEQADTCIVLHSLDVTKRNPFTDLVLYCCHTYVLLLLFYHYDKLCDTTIFCTTNRDIRFWTLPSHLGPELCTSLLGFHALTGCDQTGKVAEPFKKMCWKVLVDVSPDVSLAFRFVGQCEISDEIKAGLEEFVINSYCKDRPSDINTLGSLPWYLFSSYVILAFLLSLPFLLSLGTIRLWCPSERGWGLKYFFVVVVILCGRHKCRNPCTYNFCLK